jgi:hypothetical protein
MSIHDQDNIALLIGILEGEFDKQSVRRSNFVDFFNDKLKNYHENRFNYQNLQDMNKNILSDCYQYIDNQQKIIEKNTMVLKPPPSSHTFQTSSDNTKQKHQSESQFDNYKKEYNTLLNPKKPSEIDFSDTIEDEPIQNLDSIINQTLEDRAKELQRIANTYSDKPPDWIKPPQQNNENSQPMKLVIEESPDTGSKKTSLPVSILKTTQTNSSKKVTFKSPSNVDNLTNKQTHKIDVNNLLNKLKLKRSDIPAPSSNTSAEMEKMIYDKIEAKVEAKFAILNEKYNKLQTQYEELSMKYEELVIEPQQEINTKETDKID